MVSIVGSSATSGNWSCLSGVDDFGIGGMQVRKATVSFYSSRPNRIMMEGYNGLWEDETNFINGLLRRGPRHAVQSRRPVLQL
jgi:hypothetical protein